MRYVKLQTNYSRDPKVLGLSDAAEIMFIRGLAYVGDAETSGYIPAAAIPHLSRMKDARTLHKLCTELAQCALWIEVDGGWRVVRWAENQPEAEKLIDQRKKDAARQRKHRAKGVDKPGEKPAEDEPKPPESRRDLARAREQSLETDLKHLLPLVRRQLFGDARDSSSTTTDETLIEWWTEAAGGADLAVELKAWLMAGGGATVKNPSSALLGWLRLAGKRAAVVAPGCDQCLDGWVRDDAGERSAQRCPSCRPRLQAVGDA